MPDLLERLEALEADVRYREPAEGVEARIGVLRGLTPVLLSAPHAAIHTRHGEPKEEEEFTAAIACYVAQRAGAHALYTRRRSSTDPNWDADAAYKRHLARIVAQAGVRFVLDIHGSAPDRSFGIALGTMEGRSCPGHRDEIIALLEACGFRPDAPFPDKLDIDDTFTGQGLQGQETITWFASQELGVPAAQLELHPLLRVVERRRDASLPRPFHGDPDRIERVAGVLALLVESLGRVERGDAFSARSRPTAAAAGSL